MCDYVYGGKVIREPRNASFATWLSPHMLEGCPGNEVRQCLVNEVQWCLGNEVGQCPRNEIRWCLENESGQCPGNVVG